MTGTNPVQGSAGINTPWMGVYRLKPDKITAGKLLLISRHPDYTSDEQEFRLKAVSALEKKVEMQRHREDVVELENALKRKGTVAVRYSLRFGQGSVQAILAFNLAGGQRGDQRHVESCV